MIIKCENEEEFQAAIKANKGCYAHRFADGTSEVRTGADIPVVVAAVAE